MERAGCGKWRLPTATRTYRTGALTPRNIAVFFEPLPVRQRRFRFGVFRHGFRQDHLAAATLMFEASG
jgi:hypothetical protein